MGKYTLIGETLENNEKSRSCVDRNQLQFGNSHLEHVTFGCAVGGATEFNVIRNNCDVTQPNSATITKTSSKPKLFFSMSMVEKSPNFEQLDVHF